MIGERSKSSLEKSANEIGAISFLSDQGKNDQIDQLVSKVKSEFGKIDILAINARIFSIEPFEMVTENSFDTMKGIKCHFGL